MSLAYSFKRTISVITLLCFVFNSAAWGLPEGGISMLSKWETPSFLQIEIPEDLASVEDMYEAPAQSDPKLILHVQNLHGNYEAQVQIKKLIEYLNQQYGFKLLFAEGAVEKLNADYLKLFADEDRNLRLADYLTKQGELTGLEYYLMNSPKDVAAIGIEKSELYRKNYEAFKLVYGNKHKSDQFLAQYDQRLEKIASRIFSPDARRLLSEWKKFESGHRDFLPYVRNLADDAQKILGLDLESLFAQVEWPQVTRLLVLQSMEPDLDREAAEKDRARLIQFLKDQKISREIIDAVGKLDQKRIVMSRLDSKSRKLEDLPRYLFERLVEEAAPKGFYFHDYPAFSLWAGHLILQSEIDSKNLFAEIEKIFEKILNEVTTKQNEKDLLELYRDAQLLRKLLHLELTRKEWDRVQYRKDWMTLGAMVRRLKAINKEGSIILDKQRASSMERGVKSVTHSQLPARRSTLSQTLATAYSFYDFARQREAVFYETIEKEMAAKKTDKAILVTGGFHTDGLMDIFRSEQINYAVLMPRLTGSDLNNSDYISGMLENKPTIFDLGTIEVVNALQSALSRGDMGAGSFSEVKSRLEAFIKLAQFSSAEQAVAAFNHFNLSLYATDRKVQLVYDRDKNVVNIRVGENILAYEDGSSIDILVDQKTGSLAGHIKKGSRASASLRSEARRPKTIEEIASTLGTEWKDVALSPDSGFVVNKVYQKGDVTFELKIHRDTTWILSERRGNRTHREITWSPRNGRPHVGSLVYDTFHSIPRSGNFVLPLSDNFSRDALSSLRISGEDLILGIAANRLELHWHTLLREWQDPESSPSETRQRPHLRIESESARAEARTERNFPLQNSYSNDLVGSKKLITDTIDWLTEELHYPHDEILKKYRDKILQPDVEETGKDTASFGVMFSKERIDGEIKVRINVVDLMDFFQGIKRLNSSDYFLENFAGMIVREAWGLQIMEGAKEQDEQMNRDIQRILEIGNNQFGIGRSQNLADANYQSFLLTYKGEITRLMESLLEPEVKESIKEKNYLVWLRENGHTNPRRIDQLRLSDNLRLKSELTRGLTQVGKPLRDLFRNNFVQMIPAQYAATVIRGAKPYEKIYAYYISLKLLEGRIQTNAFVPYFHAMVHAQRTGDFGPFEEVTRTIDPKNLFQNASDDLYDLVGLDLEQYLNPRQEVRVLLRERYRPEAINAKKLDRAYLVGLLKQFANAHEVIRSSGASESEVAVAILRHDFVQRALYRGLNDVVKADPENWERDIKGFILNREVERHLNETLNSNTWIANLLKPQKKALADTLKRAVDGIREELSRVNFGLEEYRKQIQVKKEFLDQYLEFLYKSLADQTSAEAFSRDLAAIEKEGTHLRIEYDPSIRSFERARKGSPRKRAEGRSALILPDVDGNFRTQELTKTIARAAILASYSDEEERERAEVRNDSFLTTRAEGRQLSFDIEQLFRSLDATNLNDMMGAFFAPEIFRATFGQIGITPPLHRDTDYLVSASVDLNKQALIFSVKKLSGPFTDEEIKEISKVRIGVDADRGFETAKVALSLAGVKGKSNLMEVRFSRRELNIGAFKDVFFRLDVPRSEVRRQSSFAKKFLLPLMLFSFIGTGSDVLLPTLFGQEVRFESELKHGKTRLKNAVRDEEGNLVSIETRDEDGNLVETITFEDKVPLKLPTYVFQHDLDKELSSEEFNRMIAHGVLPVKIYFADFAQILKEMGIHYTGRRDGEFLIYELNGRLIKMGFEYLDDNELTIRKIVFPNPLMLLGLVQKIENPKKLGLSDENIKTLKASMAPYSEKTLGGKIIDGILSKDEWAERAREDFKSSASPLEYFLPLPSRPTTPNREENLIDNFDISRPPLPDPLIDLYTGPSLPTEVKEKSVFVEEKEEKQGNSTLDLSWRNMAYGAIGILLAGSIIFVTLAFDWISFNFLRRIDRFLPKIKNGIRILNPSVNHFIVLEGQLVEAHAAAAEEIFMSEQVGKALNALEKRYGKISRIQFKAMSLDPGPRRLDKYLQPLASDVSPIFISVTKHTLLIQVPISTFVHSSTVYLQTTIRKQIESFKPDKKNRRSEVRHDLEAAEGTAKRWFQRLPKMTVRRWMALVAVVGLGLGGWIEFQRSKKIAEDQVSLFYNLLIQEEQRQIFDFYAEKEKFLKDLNSGLPRYIAMSYFMRDFNNGHSDAAEGLALMDAEGVILPLKKMVENDRNGKAPRTPDAIHALGRIDESQSMRDYLSQLSNSALQRKRFSAIQVLARMLKDKNSKEAALIRRHLAGANESNRYAVVSGLSRNENEDVAIALLREAAASPYLDVQKEAVGALYVLLNRPKLPSKAADEIYRIAEEMRKSNNSEISTKAGALLRNRLPRPEARAELSGYDFTSVSGGMTKEQKIEKAVQVLANYFLLDLAGSLDGQTPEQIKTVIKRIEEDEDRLSPRFKELWKQILSADVELQELLRSTVDPDFKFIFDPEVIEVLRANETQYVLALALYFKNQEKLTSLILETQQSAAFGKFVVDIPLTSEDLRSYKYMAKLKLARQEARNEELIKPLSFHARVIQYLKTKLKKFIYILVHPRLHQAMAIVGVAALVMFFPIILTTYEVDVYIRTPQVGQMEVLKRWPSLTQRVALRYLVSPNSKFRDNALDVLKETHFPIDKYGWVILLYKEQPENRVVASGILQDPKILKRLLNEAPLDEIKFYSTKINQLDSDIKQRIADQIGRLGEDPSLTRKANFFLVNLDAKPLPRPEARMWADEGEPDDSEMTDEINFHEARFLELSESVVDALIDSHRDAVSEFAQMLYLHEADLADEVRINQLDALDLEGDIKALMQLVNSDEELDPVTKSNIRKLEMFYREVYDPELVDYRSIEEYLQESLLDRTAIKNIIRDPRKDMKESEVWVNLIITAFEFRSKKRVADKNDLRISLFRNLSEETLRQVRELLYQEQYFPSYQELTELIDHLYPHADQVRQNNFFKQKIRQYLSIRMKINVDENGLSATLKKAYDEIISFKQPRAENLVTVRVKFQDRTIVAHNFIEIPSEAILLAHIAEILRAIPQDSKIPQVEIVIPKDSKHHGVEIYLLSRAEVRMTGTAGLGASFNDPIDDTKRAETRARSRKNFNLPKVVITALIGVAVGGVPFYSVLMNSTKKEILTHTFYSEMVVKKNFEPEFLDPEKIQDAFSSSSQREILRSRYLFGANRLISIEVLKALSPNEEEDAKDTPKLLPLFKNDPRISVRTKIATLLGKQIHDPVVQDALIESLEYGDPNLKVEVIRQLKPLLKSPDIETRQKVLNQFRKLIVEDYPHSSARVEVFKALYEISLTDSEERLYVADSIMSFLKRKPYSNPNFGLQAVLGLEAFSDLPEVKSFLENFVQDADGKTHPTILSETQRILDAGKRREISPIRVEQPLPAPNLTFHTQKLQPFRSDMKIRVILPGEVNLYVSPVTITKNHLAGDASEIIVDRARINPLEANYVVIRKDDNDILLPFTNPASFARILKENETKEGDIVRVAFPESAILNPEDAFWPTAYLYRLEVTANANLLNPTTEKYELPKGNGSEIDLHRVEHIEYQGKTYPVWGPQQIHDLLKELGIKSGEKLNFLYGDTFRDRLPSTVPRSEARKSPIYNLFHPNGLPESFEEFEAIGEQLKELSKRHKDFLRHFYYPPNIRNGRGNQSKRLEYLRQAREKWIDTHKETGATRPRKMDTFELTWLFNQYRKQGGFERMVELFESATDEDFKDSDAIRSDYILALNRLGLREIVSGRSNRLKREALLDEAIEKSEAFIAERENEAKKISGAEDLLLELEKEPARRNPAKLVEHLNDVNRYFFGSDFFPEPQFRNPDGTLNPNAIATALVDPSAKQKLAQEIKAKIKKVLYQDTYMGLGTAHKNKYVLTLDLLTLLNGFNEDPKNSEEKLRPLLRLYERYFPETLLKNKVFRKAGGEFSSGLAYGAFLKNPTFVTQFIEEVEGHLEKELETATVIYHSAYEQNILNYYAGINVVRNLIYKGGEDALRNAQELAQLVGYSAREANQKEFWPKATLLELSLLRDEGILAVLENLWEVLIGMENGNGDELASLINHLERWQMLNKERGQVQHHLNYVIRVLQAFLGHEDLREISEYDKLSDFLRSLPVSDEKRNLLAIHEHKVTDTGMLLTRAIKSSMIVLDKERSVSVLPNRGVVPNTINNAADSEIFRRIVEYTGPGMEKALRDITDDAELDSAVNDLVERVFHLVEIVDGKKVRKLRDLKGNFHNDFDIAANAFKNWVSHADRENINATNITILALIGIGDCRNTNFFKQRLIGAVHRYQLAQDMHEARVLLEKGDFNGYQDALRRIAENDKARLKAAVIQVGVEANVFLRNNEIYDIQTTEGSKGKRPYTAQYVINSRTGMGKTIDPGTISRMPWTIRFIYIAWLNFLKSIGIAEVISAKKITGEEHTLTIAYEESGYHLKRCLVQI
jgi:hypothetical protein